MSVRIGILQPGDTPAVGQNSGSSDWTELAEDIHRVLKADGRYEEFLDPRWHPVADEIVGLFNRAKWTVELDPADRPERILRIYYVAPPPPPPQVVRPEEVPAVAATANGGTGNQSDDEVVRRDDLASQPGDEVVEASVALCACGDGCFVSQLDPAAGALLNLPPQLGMDSVLDLNSLQGCRTGEAGPCLACAIGQPCLSGIDGDRPSIELSAVGALPSVGQKLVERDGESLTEAVPGQTLLLVGDQADPPPSVRTDDQPALAPSAARDTQQNTSATESSTNPAIAGLVVTLLIVGMVVVMALLGVASR